jgi:hypothetical protein
VTATAEPATRDRATDRVAGWLFTTPLWILNAAAIAVTVAWFGLAFTDNESAWRSVAVDPFTQHSTGPATYVYNSPIGPAITWLLTDSSKEAWRLVHLLLAVAAIYTTVYLVRRWRGDLIARLVLLAWFCSPLANLTVTWIGQPDPVTILAATMITLGPSWACLTGGALLGFNHFEQGVFIAAAAIILRVAVQHQPRRCASFIAGGILGGRAALWLVHTVNGMNTGGARLGYIVDHGAGDYLRATGHNLPALIFSVYAALWIPVAMWMRDLPARETRVAVGVQVGLFAVTVLTLDVTRVAALITWPVVLTVAVWAATRPSVRRDATILIGIALIVPRVTVTWGEVAVSAWDRSFTH